MEGASYLFPTKLRQIAVQTCALVGFKDKSKNFGGTRTRRVSRLDRKVPLPPTEPTGLSSAGFTEPGAEETQKKTCVT